MKKLLFIALVALGMNAKAQITLEHTYDSAATWNTCYGNVSQLMIVKFEVSGERYVKINRCGRVMSIYDMNHSLIKNISLANLPLNPSTPANIVGELLYLSENLFNTDSKMEYMYLYNITGQRVTNIYNEEGILIFADSSCYPWVIPNYEEQQYPIYNTSYGTKMILSYTNGQAKVFSLPGTLTTSIHEANQSLLSASNLVSNAYPNPTTTTTTTRIDYTFPNGVDHGEIVFYDLQGKEIRRYKVDRTFDHLLISTADIPAGTYFYQLQTSSQVSAGKKMVVIK